MLLLPWIHFQWCKTISGWLLFAIRNAKTTYTDKTVLNANETIRLHFSTEHWLVFVVSKRRKYVWIYICIFGFTKFYHLFVSSGISILFVCTQCALSVMPLIVFSFHRWLFSFYLLPFLSLWLVSLLVRLTAGFPRLLIP